MNFLQILSNKEKILISVDTTLFVQPEGYDSLSGIMHDFVVRWDKKRPSCYILQKSGLFLETGMKSLFFKIALGGGLHNIGGEYMESQGRELVFPRGGLFSQFFPSENQADDIDSVG